jgi:signal transduction histidine kinase
MRHAKLLRSTPFRLALTFGLAFIVAFFLAGLITYQMLGRGLARQLDEAVDETYSVVASTYAQNDVEDLVAAVNTYARLRSVDHSIFSLENAAGNRLAGNFTPPVLALGLTTREASALGLPGQGVYRIRVGIVGDNRLVVGQSFTETERLADILLVSLGWAAGFIVLTAVLGGFFLAARAQSWLDAVAQTMIDVSNGRLETRIPLRGNGDDIDLVSARINDALGRLSGLVEGMRQVSSDIAHELKTPLNRLRMTLEGAADRNDRGQPIGPHIADALSESDQINATFDALLRISQIEAGARKTRFRPVDLTDLLASIAEIYGGVAEDAGQALQLSAPDDVSVSVTGDRDLLIQMFVNLIENAITHCPKGTSISVSLALETGAAEVFVSDNGPGIPFAEREKVFQRLYRLEKSRTSQGSGLGLSLVRAIADLHSIELLLKDNNPGLAVCMIFPRL